MKHLRLLGAWAFACVALAFAAPALADNQTSKNASGTTFTFCTKTVTSVEHPCHVMEGYDGSAYRVFSVDSSGRINANINGSVGLTSNYAEDVASASADVGTVVLGVRASSPANTSGANGDYEPLQVNGGRLWTSTVVDTALPAGTNNIGKVVTATTLNPTSTFTWPAGTPSIDIGDLIANHGTAGSITVPTITVAASACSFDVAAGTLSINATSGMDGAVMTARLWRTAPTYTNGDTGAYAVATGMGGFLGAFTCVLTQGADAAAGSCISASGFPLSIKLASGTTVAWDLQAQSVFTRQASKAPILTLYTKQDPC